jgi:outer membrane protein assembly factor BamB
MPRTAAFFSMLLLAGTALAQKDTRVYTAAKVPSPRDLDRLNLTMDWKVFLPLENRGDAIASVQMIEGQIFVQTRSNILVVLREDSGEEVWRMTMPKRYLPTFPVAVNRDLVLVINGPRLYLLDRSNGKFKYDIDLPSTVAAGLAADQQQCYVVLSSNRIVAIGLLPEDVQLGQLVRPKMERPEPPTGTSVAIEASGELESVQNRTPSVNMLESLRYPFVTKARDKVASVNMLPSLRKPYQLDNGNRSPSAQMVSNLAQLSQLTEINRPDRPRILWELQTNRRTDDPALMYGEFLIFTGTDRSVFVSDKHADKENKIRHEWFADTNLSAPLGQYGTDLYASVSDGSVYWLNLESFRNPDVAVNPIKRLPTGYPIDRKPVTTDDSIYLSSMISGVWRIDRKSFEKLWRNDEAVRFYAVNPNVIYAGDKSGNLLVLDKARGLKLATLDIKDFGFPVINEVDDRLYLAANNGLLVCLRDRGFRRPELLRKKEPKPVVVDQPAKEPEAPKKEPPKKEPPKKEEPKKEEPKKEEPKKEEPKKDEAKKG